MFDTLKQLFGSGESANLSAAEIAKNEEKKRQLALQMIQAAGNNSQPQQPKAGLLSQGGGQQQAIQPISYGGQQTSQQGLLDLLMQLSQQQGVR